MFNSNVRLGFNVFWIVLGAVLLGLSVAEILDSSVYSGMGGALMAVGILQTVRIMKYRKDPTYKEEIDIKMHDERNTFLRMKSWAWTGYIVLLAEAVGCVAAMVLGKTTVQIVLGGAVCLMLLVYFAVYFVLKRKY
ncbi:MAG: hypothetical protein K6B12_02935 [Clostridiales bacterium]|nr:hypothetical protein [Clostridiales bacterium]